MYLCQAFSIFLFLTAQNPHCVMNVLMETGKDGKQALQNFSIYPKAIKD